MSSRLVTEKPEKKDAREPNSRGRLREVVERGVVRVDRRVLGDVADDDIVNKPVQKQG
jgi:hypothetical protein